MLAGDKIFFTPIYYNRIGGGIDKGEFETRPYTLRPYEPRPYEPRSCSSQFRNVLHTITRNNTKVFAEH